MDLHENLKGKTVVITGGSGILCREFAYAYAKQGMNVAVLGRTLSKLEEVRDKINELGGNGLAVVCDVVDKNSVINAKKVVNDTFGKVDILVNGAGGNHPKGTTTKEYFEKGDIENPNVVSFFDLSKENFNYVFDLNIVGTLIPTQVFIVDMLDNPGANVLNIASMSSLAPGWFETVQNKTLLRNPDGSLSERSKKVLAHTPMGRFGVPEDLTGTLLWLTDSAQSGFVTGATIPVDGGFQAYFGV